ncbi:MAG: hypothetical protein KBD00_05645 [Candidatus Peribacteraceae bacterium]|nr:hypothetical protein [Candidatus Peribacteraceae bacterium]
MNPIATTVEKIVMRWPLVEEGLARGILNLSALAREIQPEVETLQMQPVSESAIMMALKRIGQKWNKHEKSMRLPIDLKDITLQTNLMEFVFHKPTHPNQLHRSLMELMERTDETMNYSQGLHETTVFVKSHLEKEVDTVTKYVAHLKRKMHKLCSITVRISQDTAAIAGVYYYILRTLAWQNINLIEVLSIDSELVLFFEEEMVDKAFAAIKAITFKNQS